MGIQPDHENQTRRSDLVAINENDQNCQIKDVKIESKNETGRKSIKYQDLTREVRRMWGLNTQVIPLVVK